MSNFNRGFVRRKLSLFAENMINSDGGFIKYNSGDVFEANAFEMKRLEIDTEWKLEMLIVEDHNAMKWIVINLIILEEVKANLIVKVTAYVEMPDGSLESLVVHSDHVSAFEQGFKVLEISDESFKLFKFERGKRDVRFHFEIELIEAEKFLPRIAENRNENYEKLLNNENFSDFSFFCSDGETINANSCIIAIQCPAFEAMLEAKMKESRTAEAAIEDVDSETMLELLRFVYCGKVNDIAKVDDKLLAAANKYGIEELKPLCISSLMDNLDIENVMEVLALADLHDQKHLKQNCIDFIKCKYERIRKSEKWSKLPTAIMKEILDSAVDNPVQFLGSFVKQTKVPKNASQVVVALTDEDSS